MATGNRMILEVCCGDMQSVAAANAGGASRIELCSALGEGGVTPSYGFMKEACLMSQIPVNVLIRPRGGDFVYTPEEVNVMVRDIRAAKECGCNGVVIGALTPQGEIDMESCRLMVEAADGVHITFHRAFDLCCDHREALERIIELGCDRILTSGLAQSALDGADTLRELVRLADNRIVILAGAGVGPQNARRIADLTGVAELHASARSSFDSPMVYKRPGVSMGVPGSDEYSRKASDPEVVASIVKELEK